MRKRPLKLSNKLMKRVSVFRISSHGNPLLISSPDSYSAGKHTVWAISRKDAWQTTIPRYVSLLITRYCLSRLYPLTFPILSGSVALWWRSQKWGHERESGVGTNRLRLKARTAVNRVFFSSERVMRPLGWHHACAVCLTTAPQIESAALVCKVFLPLAQWIPVPLHWASNIAQHA